MKLIVGLGNPGLDYLGTRHNVGFEVVDALAGYLGWGVFDKLAKSKFDGLAYDGAIETARGVEKVLLLKPMTYMNVSGRSVRQAMTFYKAEPADVLVVVDELALPAGKLRLRGDGTSGGHNGLKDIERAFGTKAYPRLRIGIDAPPPRIPGKDYVLQKFTTDQRIAVDLALPKAAACCITWADNGISKAMNLFNAADDDAS